MKRILLLLMICILCFCTACTQPQQQDPPTEPPTADNTPQPTEDPTENTEPPAPIWLPQQTEKLSSEEYFAEDRPYITNPYSWLVEEAGVYKGYTLYLTDQGLQVHAYDPNFWGEPGELLYTVPDSDTLATWELLGTDGITAYCAKRAGLISNIIAVDLVTGAHSWIVNDAEIVTAHYCGDVLFYAQFLDGQVVIIRRYLPTGQEQYIYTGDTVPAMFGMSPPVSTHGDISWTGVSADMVTKLMEVLEDPESKYQQDPDSEGLWGIDLSDLWADKGVFLNGNTRSLQMLCFRIQSETGIPSLRSTQYNIFTGEQTEKTGVIDNCWFGSGYNHDHYDPDAPAPAKPSASLSDWQPFVETVPATETQPLDGRLILHNDLLYLVSGNTFTLLTDIPIQAYRQTEAAFDAEDGIICAITQDNDLVRVYTDGTAPIVLYSGQSTLGRLSYMGSMLFVMDGSSIIQLDANTQQYRTVFTGEDLSWCYCDSETVLYMELVSGLHVDAYLYDLTTGEITETGYRL